MVHVENLDRELSSAIALLNDAQKQAMLAVANAFLHDEESAGRYKWENDPDFVAELDAEWADYKNGGKVYSAAEVEAEANVLLQSFKNK